MINKDTNINLILGFGNIKINIKDIDSHSLFNINYCTSFSFLKGEIKKIMLQWNFVPKII